MEPANKEATHELKAVQELLARDEKTQRNGAQSALDVDSAQSAGSVVNKVAKSPAPVLEKKSEVFLQQVTHAKKSANEALRAQDEREESDAATHKQETVAAASTTTTSTPVKEVKHSPEIAAVVAHKPVTVLPALIPTSIPDVAPKHYYEFERSWNSIKDDTAACYRYFKVITAEMHDISRY